MRVEPFLLERVQSEWEHRVRYNLSESGVHPLSVRELVRDDAGIATVLDAPLIYTQTNGTPDLRGAIASLHPGATTDHIQVTNGGSEANFVAVWHLVQPGDEVVVQVPAYLQTAGLVRAFGGSVRPWPMIRDAAGRWRADLERLPDLLSAKTRAIVISTPNNPTGARLDDGDLTAIAAAADRIGAWIISDEIYCGAEFDGHDSPSMWGRSERVIVTNGLSKAYGLPGLRIGWAVAPPDVTAALWAHHDYTTIAPGALSDRLATIALDPAVRPTLLARTRAIVRENVERAETWLRSCGDTFTWTAPEAGAFVFARYGLDVNSTALTTRLREEESVLVVPGDAFGMDGYVRLGIGERADYVMAGLDRFKALLDRLALATR